MGGGDLSIWIQLSIFLIFLLFYLPISCCVIVPLTISLPDAPGMPPLVGRLPVFGLSLSVFDCFVPCLAIEWTVFMHSGCLVNLKTAVPVVKLCISRPTELCPASLILLTTSPFARWVLVTVPLALLLYRRREIDNTRVVVGLEFRTTSFGRG